MRLINADAEKQKINQEIGRYEAKLKRLKSLRSKEPHNTYHDWNSEIKNKEHDIALCKQEIRIIDAYPTAYNVDKVIEQIEDIMKDDKMRFADQVVREAVKLVRAGGV